MTGKEYHHINKLIDKWEEEKKLRAKSSAETGSQEHKDVQKGAIIALDHCIETMRSLLWELNA